MTKRQRGHSPWEPLGHGICCIDAGYIRPGNACFYLLQHDGELAFIETGTNSSVERALDLLRSLDLRPEQVRYVIPTHVHLDHAGGAGTMMQCFPRASLVVHPRGARHLADPTRLIESAISVYGEKRYRALYGKVSGVESSRIIEAEDGQTLILGGRSLVLRHTPGHADHHLCVWDDASRGWFSGDVFGVSYAAMRRNGTTSVLPTTTPTQFRPDALIESVRLLASYSPRSIYLTHFGALSFSSALADDLISQVGVYREIALDCEDLPGRSAVIAQRLRRHFEKSLPPGQEERNRSAVKRLAADFELNAQGLEAFLQRRQRESARPG